MPAIISASGPGKRASRPRTGEGTSIPELPRYTVDTTYSLPGGTEHVCTTAGQFTTALANCARGDVITLTAGNTFSGHFTLPAKSGTGWVYIRSSGLGSLPAGTRVTSGANMAAIQGTASANGPVISAASGASHWRIAGIEIRMPTDQAYANARVDLGDDPLQAVVPSYIIFDRCWIHGDATYAGSTGIELSGAHIALIDSRVDDCAQIGAERQAVIIAYGPGPFLVHNNYLEGAGENLMVGGVGYDSVGELPFDITITQNHMYLPLAWAKNGASFFTVKNLLEFKSGERILVEGNKLENLWSGQGQGGFSVLITPRQQGGSGDTDQNRTRDITIRKNKLVNVCQGFNISGGDTDTYSGPHNGSVLATQRILIENNQVEVTAITATGSGTVTTDNTISAKFFQVSAAPDWDNTDSLRLTGLVIRHNTLFASDSLEVGPKPMLFGGIKKLVDFVYQDNIVTHGTGMSGDGGALGGSTANAALTNYCDAYTVTKNLLFPISGVSTDWPSGNLFEATTAGVGFTNHTNDSTGDYSLSGGSAYNNAASDGTDIGCDITALELALVD